MPCIARWPGKIPAGRVDKESVLTGVDWLPTVCSLAGIELPEIQPDGEDVSDILMGRSRPRARPIYWETRSVALGDERHRSPNLATRDGKWKLLINPDGEGAELHDIPADPEERANLAQDHPDVVQELSAKLLAWRKTLPD
jgi:N-acetylgalactosamine-6-sulfatase